MNNEVTVYWNRAPISFRQVSSTGGCAALTLTAGTTYTPLPWQVRNPKLDTWDRLDRLERAAQERERIEQEKVKMNTRALYEAWIITNADDTVTHVDAFIAKSDGAAQVKAAMLAKVADPDLVTIIIRQIHTLPSKKELRDGE
jgi:hypothetical protein